MGGQHKVGAVADPPMTLYQEEGGANPHATRRLALAGGDGMAGGVILLEAHLEGQVHQCRREHCHNVR